VNQPTEKKIVIRVKDVYKSYGKLEVLKGLCLEVFQGETVVILGRSGVGKSVLLRQILGIETPDKGSIEVNDQRISHMSQTKRYEAVKEMGMLFQGAALFDSLTVGENVAFYLRQHESKLEEKEVQQRVAEAINVVNLEGVQQKMPSDLSGGMRKRAGLARALALDPELLFLDEPTSGLDPISAALFDELVNSLQESLGLTVFMVTHDIDSLRATTDRIAVLVGGKVKVGTIDELVHDSDPWIHEYFSGVRGRAALNA